MAQAESALMRKYPVIKNLHKNPGRQRERLRKKLKPEIDRYLATKGKTVQEVTSKEWFLFLVSFAEGRGKCVYATGEKGICPKTASTYTFQLKVLLEQEFTVSVDKLWPDFQYIPGEWKKSIAGDLMYQRKAAEYFSMADLKRYLRALEIIAADSDSTPADQYYATMAQVLLSITITQAGCRMIELLQSRPQLVYMGEAADNRVGIAIASIGTKADKGNQHSSPISFIAQKDKEICPVEKLGGVSLRASGLNVFSGRGAAEHAKNYAVLSPT